MKTAHDKNNNNDDNSNNDEDEEKLTFYLMFSVSVFLFGKCEPEIRNVFFLSTSLHLLKQHRGTFFFFLAFLIPLFTVEVKALSLFHHCFLEHLSCLFHYVHCRSFS